MSPKLKIICKAVLIRLERGEALIDILASYPSLTIPEQEQIEEYVNSILVENLN